MKVAALVSGGKDSCFAMMRCIDYGHEIVALANLMPFDDAVDELDSYMYQTVGHQIVVSYAECMGLPLFRRRIRGSTRHQDLSYKVTPGDEVEDMFILLNGVKQQIPSITAVSSGAIASDYQRLRVESVCARLGLVSLAYLWKQDQTLLLEEMIQRGITAIIIKVAAMGLNPAKHLGKELSELQAHLLRMKELYGINVCGEGGEYETLTLDCPLFTNARIILDKFQVILHSPDSIAPVGVLHPLAFHLKHKTEVLSLSSDNNDCSEKSHRIYEVQGDNLQGCVVKCQSMDLAPDFGMTRKPNLCISTPKRDMFSVGCWIRSPSKPLGDLQEDLTMALGRIESQLKKDGFDWANVLYVHMYISDMKHFALANEVYVKFITEKKCYWGVPSRSTIELPLTQAGLGNAYIEVLVANDQCKRVLHVQSISCWAPSCIGPYSQATLHKEILYMAGQLGLDPPTMTLCSGGAAVEIEQALKNCEAVANCFNASVSTSTIIFDIYCSASLTACEKTEIESMVNHFLKQKAFNLQKENSSISSNPIFLYILASSLPKGALVEIKPVLLVPENEEDEANTIVPPKPCREVPSYWGFEYSKWRDCCCQLYTFRDKICTALVSIAKQTATSICSEIDPSLSDVHYGSEMHVKSIAKFCVYLLDGVLFENHFTWDNVMHLRFYFASDLPVAADMLTTIFSTACEEFGEQTGRVTMADEPIFSLVPVLGSGRSTSMDDMITCELFATKS